MANTTARLFWQSQNLAEVSQIVRMLASNTGVVGGTMLLNSSTVAAMQITAPAPDCAAAAKAAGWRLSEQPIEGYWVFRKYGNRSVWKTVNEPLARHWNALCEYAGINPKLIYPVDHWAVAGDLAQALREKGERVTAIAGLFVWSRFDRDGNVSANVWDDPAIIDIAAETKPTEVIAALKWLVDDCEDAGVQGSDAITNAGRVLRAWAGEG